MLPDVIQFGKYKTGRVNHSSGSETGDSHGDTYTAYSTVCNYAHTFGRENIVQQYSDKVAV